jgi:hypothetical protein
VHQSAKRRRAITHAEWRRDEKEGGRQGVDERIMLRELLRRVDMMVILENRLDALVRLHTPWPPGLIGGTYQYDIASNLSPESLSGPNADLTEILVRAGFVTTAYDPVFALSPDGTRYVSAPSRTPTTIPAPGLPFSLGFRAARPGGRAPEDRVCLRGRLPPPHPAAGLRPVVVGWANAAPTFRLMHNAGSALPTRS